MELADLLGISTEADLPGVSTQKDHPPAPSATPRHQWLLRYSRRLVVVDTIAVVVAIALAQWVRFGYLGIETTAHRGLNYTIVAVVIAAGWLLLLSMYHTRSPRIIGTGVEEYRRVWRATIALFGTVAIISMLFKLEIARGYLAIALPVGAVGILSGRYVARKILAASRRRGRCTTRMLIVGHISAVEELARSLARDGDAGYQVVGACVPGGSADDRIEVGGLTHIPTFGDETQVMAALAATNPDVVALTATEDLGPQWIRALSWQLEKFNVELMVAPGLVDVAGPRLTMRPVSGHPLILVEKPQYTEAKRIGKRTFDILFAAAFLLLTLPLTIAIGIAVKASSRGPLFYWSERIGLDGKPFRMVKFRTMVKDADQHMDELATFNESEGGVLFKIRRDPRVTSVGRVLRHYSLDEIPQFFNVLKGDMSVVGPRPPLSKEVLTYSSEVKRRLLVRPGITGLWQVNGRSNLSWEDTVRLDLFYVENWSMIADIAIVLKTAQAMFSGSGAY